MKKTFSLLDSMRKMMGMMRIAVIKVKDIAMMVIERNSFGLASEPNS